MHENIGFHNIGFLEKEGKNIGHNIQTYTKNYHGVTPLLVRAEFWLRDLPFLVPKLQRDLILHPTQNYFSGEDIQIIIQKLHGKKSKDF